MRYVLMMSIIFIALSASGQYSLIPGGGDNTVSGDYSLAFGNGVSVDDDHVVAFYNASEPGKLGINNPDPHSTLQFDGSFSSNVLIPPAGAVDISSTTDGEKNFTIFVDGAVHTSVTLPDPTDIIGRIYVIRNTSQTTPITIYTAGVGAWIDYLDHRDIDPRDGIIVQSAGIYSGRPRWWVIGEINTP